MIDWPAGGAPLIRSFANAILHGDDEHKVWLLEAAEAFIADKPLPPPRSKPLNTETGPAVYKHLSLEGLKEGYELAELENSNLRKHLVWLMEQIPGDLRPFAVRLLAERIRQPIEQGGVVKNCEEDEREDLLRLHCAIEKLTDHVEKGIEYKEPDLYWWQQLDTYANQLRSFLPPGPLPITLHEIREGKI